MVVRSQLRRLDVAAVHGEELVARSAAHLHAIVEAQLHDLIEAGDHEGLWCRDLNPLSRSVHIGGVVRVDTERLAETRPIEQLIEPDQALVGVDERVAREARVGRVDAACVRRRVPAVDGGIELHAGIGALPRCLGDLTEEFARLDGLNDLTGGDGAQMPVGVVEYGLHELVGDPHRVVGVLVLRGVAVLAVEVHVEPCVAQHPRLALLDRLAPDEVLHVGMVGIEDDHLGRPPRLAARLDCACRRVGAPHEADRARRRAAALEVLLGRPDVGQVDARPRAALEDRAFLDVPVEDRLHGVVDVQDKASACLIWFTVNADVEPHRRVERRLLVDDQVLELGVEGLGFSLVDEVAILAAPRRDRIDHPVGDLTQ